MVWSPKTYATYAGTFTFLVGLTANFTLRMAGKTVTERRWKDQQPQQNQTVASGLLFEAIDIDVDGEGNDALLIHQQLFGRNMRVLSTKAPTTMPLQLSVDVPKATHVTIMTGVGYLLSVAS